MEPSFSNFRLGSPVDIFRLVVFAWELSFRIFRLGTFAWNIAGYVACSFALNRSPGIFHLEPLGIVRFETSSRLRQPAVSILSLESFDEDLSLAIVRDLSLGNARSACAGRLGLSLGIFRLGTSV